MGIIVLILLSVRKRETFRYVTEIRDVQSMNSGDYGFDRVGSFLL